jgi:outer membrane receptor protein involved in Fe transport
MPRVFGIFNEVRTMQSRRPFGRRDRVRSTLATGVLASLAASAVAQERFSATTLDTLIVTSERIPVRASASPTAVQVISGETLRNLPARNLAEALATTPGFVFASFDGGLGRPLPIVRGFYGGGETGYLQILIDGNPINRSENGLVAWDMVPLSAIERVEIVRGASSAQYGDAAVGGVINIITRASGWSMVGLEGGSFGRLAGQASLGQRDSWLSRMYASLERVDGFREHSSRTSLASGSTFMLLDDDDRRLRLRTTSYDSEAEIPGALPADLAATDPTASIPFYRFDAEDEARYSAALEGEWQPDERTAVSATLSGVHRNAEVTRTLPFSPFFADTQLNDLTSNELQLAGQWSRQSSSRLAGTTLVGLQLGRSWLDTRYSLVTRGPEGVYAGAPGRPNPLPLVQGDITRSALALYAQRDWWLTPALRLVIGARGDRLEDESSLRGQPGTTEQSLDAWSGRTGLSWTYADSGADRGSIYVAASREFRAPTLVQLFDPRPVPTPFGDITLSNAELEPQIGTGFEAGMNHRRTFGGVDERALSLSLAVYHLEVRDEIDFDLSIFRYGNIARSLHRGVEAGAEYQLGANTMFVNYTRQDVENRNTGLQIKAVPLDTANLGWRYGQADGINASVVARYVGGAYLDDANEQRLDAYTTVSARIGYRRGPAYVYMEAFNLLDETYASTGYVLDFQTPDGGFGRGTYLYPAPGRSVQVGVQWTF